MMACLESRNEDNTLLTPIQELGLGKFDEKHCCNGEVIACTSLILLQTVLQCACSLLFTLDNRDVSIIYVLMRFAKIKLWLGELGYHQKGFKPTIPDSQAIDINFNKQRRNRPYYLCSRSGIQQ